MATARTFAESFKNFQKPSKTPKYRDPLIRSCMVKSCTVGSNPTLSEFKGEYDLAESMLKRLIKALETVVGTANPVVADKLEALAIAYDQQGKKDLAEDVRDRAGTIRSKVH